MESYRELAQRVTECADDLASDLRRLQNDSHNQKRKASVKESVEVLRVALDIVLIVLKQKGI